jgi:hypothetical protein
MNVLDDWLAEAADVLGIEREAVQRDLLLELTRDVAHAVTRPAAPLTAFLVGLAAGKAGGSAADVQAAVARLMQALASRPAASDGQPRDVPA